MDINLMGTWNRAWIDVIAFKQDPIVEPMKSSRASMDVIESKQALIHFHWSWLCLNESEQGSISLDCFFTSVNDDDQIQTCSIGSSWYGIECLNATRLVMFGWIHAWLVVFDANIVQYVRIVRNRVFWTLIGISVNSTVIYYTTDLVLKVKGYELNSWQFQVQHGLGSKHKYTWWDWTIARKLAKFQNNIFPIFPVFQKF